MQKIRWFFLILAIILTLAAIFQNNQNAEIHLLWLKRTLPLSMLLLTTSAIGFLFGAVVTASMLRSHRKHKEAAAKTNSHHPNPGKPIESIPPKSAAD